MQGPVAGGLKMSAPITETEAVEAPLAVPVCVHSAFAHSLRKSAPEPFNKFLEHFACAILMGKYVVLAAQEDPSDPESLSLALTLPTYADEEKADAEAGAGGEEHVREGFVVVAPGTELDEKARGMFEEIAQGHYPAGMLAETCVGPLQALFAYVMERFEELSTSPALPALKRSMHTVVGQAMEKLAAKAQAVGSAKLPELDPILAECEVDVITAFRDAVEEGSELRGYFERLLELHAVLPTDEDAVTDLMNAAHEEHDEEGDEHHHHHEHSHEGGCCGGH